MASSTSSAAIYDVLYTLTYLQIDIKVSTAYRSLLNDSGNFKINILISDRQDILLLELAIYIELHIN